MFKFPSVFIVIFCVFFNACGGSKASKSDQEKDFAGNNATNALKDSVLTIPNNVQLSAVSSSGKKNKLIPDDGLGGNVYGKIASAIKYSETVKGNITEFLDFIFTDKELAKVEIGKLIETEAGTITKFQLDDIEGVAGETYKWKLSLYFFFSNTPDIICRFSFEKGRMKGQMRHSGSEQHKETVNGFERFFYTYYYHDIRFDGVSDMKSLDIDYVVDESEKFNFAEQYWFQLTNKQKSDLKLGETGKASIRVQFDGIEYGITGTSYSPGANLLAQLNREFRLFGEDRSTYSFRVKSITGTTDGAKMEVALPVDTQTDTTDIWTNDNFATLFATELYEFLESYAMQMIDNVDDTVIAKADYLGTALLNSVDFDGDIATEQRIGFNFIYQYLGNQIGINTLAQHGNVFTAEEFSNATTFWGSSDFTAHNLTNLTDLNNWFATNDGTVTNTEKEAVYYQIMASSVISYYQTNSIVFTLDQIKTHLASQDSTNATSFKNLIETNQLIVNPAFFEKDVGLLGTFDGTTFYNYDYIFDTLTAGTAPDIFTPLNALDLTSIEAIPANDVYTLEIEVK